MAETPSEQPSRTPAKAGAFALLIAAIVGVLAPLTTARNAGAGAYCRSTMARDFAAGSYGAGCDAFLA